MLYLDVSAAVHSRAGLGRYSQSLAQAMAAQHPGRVALFHNQGGDATIPASLAGLPRRSVRLGYKPWRMAVLLAHVGHMAFNRLVPGASLFHSTEHLLFPLRGRPVVLTVHDLIYKLFPGYHKKLNYWYLNLAMPLFCRRADAIIAVSQATKGDIVSHYRVDPGKIHVVPEAPATHFRPPTAAEVARVRAAYDLPPRFLLHLGTVEPRKNLGRLVDALLRLQPEYDDLHLVLAGSKGWLVDDLFARLQQDGLAGRVRPLGWVPDEALPAVLAAADLVVQPSLYEGFGLPILEAMASGQVVAASDSSSHPEVGGDAAAYFPPDNSEAMAAVIARLLTDRQEYERRREAGLRQAQRFSWERAARETYEVYARVLEE